MAAVAQIASTSSTGQAGGLGSSSHPSGGMDVDPSPGLGPAPGMCWVKVGVSSVVSTLTFFFVVDILFQDLIPDPLSFPPKSLPLLVCLSPPLAA